jgi:hypothetical protein
VPRLRRLVAGVSPRRHGFNSVSVRVRFVVDKVVLGQVLLRVLPSSSVSIIIPLTLCTHPLLNTTLIGRTSGRRLGTLKQTMFSFGCRGYIGHDSAFTSDSCHTICHQPLKIDYGFTSKREKCINQLAQESPLGSASSFIKCNKIYFILTSHRNF